MATVDVDVSAKNPMESKNPETTNGLSFKPYFCPVDIADPFDTVAWEKRSAEIKGENGESSPQHVFQTIRTDHDDLLAHSQSC